MKASLNDTVQQPAEAGPSRSFFDYIHTAKSFWWIGMLIIVVFTLAGAGIAYKTNRQFTAFASIEVLRKETNILKMNAMLEDQLRGPEDLNTLSKVLESSAIIQRVADRFTEEENRKFLAPYLKADSRANLEPAQILALNRKVTLVRQTRILTVAYSHPDASVAALVANAFTDEFLSYNARWRADEALRAVEDLRIRADQQSRKVREIAASLQEYKEKNNVVSLDQRKDIVTDKLKTLNMQLTVASNRLDESRMKCQQVREYQQKSADLRELPFLGNLPIIQTLQQQVAMQKLSVSQLSQRYMEKHPRMREALHTLQQSENELRNALEIAAANVFNDFESAQRAYEQAKSDFAAQETQTHKVDRLGLDYLSLNNELMVNEQIHANIIARMRETAMAANIEVQNARLIDRASIPNRPSSKNPLMIFLAAVVLGVLAGAATVMLLAFLDDRVKTVADVEYVVGAPVIGVLPHVDQPDQVIKSQIVVNESDIRALESFLSLHATLRINTPSRPQPRAFLITSTGPGEGKTFVTTNLALTFATHSERTIVIDADLRRPHLHEAFGLDNTLGLVDVLAGNASLDQVIKTHKSSGLNIITAGIPPRNPTQLLTSQKFLDLVEALRRRYDRIFFDTPPLSPVSDSMIILPLCDASIFTMLHNRVNRRDAKICVSRLSSSTTTPCLGTVLNGLTSNQLPHRYHAYFGRPTPEVAQKT
jgi:capsular exopolysaccharide synthesis family protein